MSVCNKLAEIEVEYEDVDVPTTTTTSHYAPSPRALGIIKHTKKTVQYDYALSNSVVRKFIIEYVLYSAIMMWSKSDELSAIRQCFAR